MTRRYLQASHLRSQNSSEIWIAPPSQSEARVRLMTLTKPSQSVTVKDSSSISSRQREIVALAVGQANRCGYCLAAHSVIGRGAGLSADAIAAARAGRGLEPRDAALARFAQTVVERRGNVDDREFDAFIGAGFGAGEAIEVVALVAQNTLTNYVNHLAGTAFDVPVVALDLPNSQAA